MATPSKVAAAHDNINPNPQQYNPKPLTTPPPTPNPTPQGYFLKFGDYSYIDACELQLGKMALRGLTVVAGVCVCVCVWVCV